MGTLAALGSESQQVVLMQVLRLSGIGLAGVLAFMTLFYLAILALTAVFPGSRDDAPR